MKLFFIILLFSVKLSIAQTLDSLDYYMQILKRADVSLEEQKNAGLKIRQLQYDRYKESIGSADYKEESKVILRSKMVKANVDTTVKMLFSIVQNESLPISIRQESLTQINDYDGFLTDSFLIANIAGFTMLSNAEMTSGWFGEIFPCFLLLYHRAYENFNFIKPVFHNLSVPKTETETLLISEMLKMVAPITVLDEIINFYMVYRFDNETVLSNLSQLKQKLKE